MTLTFAMLPFSLAHIGSEYSTPTVELASLHSRTGGECQIFDPLTQARAPTQDPPPPMRSLMPDV